MGETQDAASGSIGIATWAGRKMATAVLLPVYLVQRVYYHVTKGGAIGASFNQARDELKEALKAFPDSIHVQSVSATDQGETARPTIQGRRPSTVHGPKTRRPTPSEIAREKTPDQPPRDRGEDRSRDDRPGRGRGRE